MIPVGELRERLITLSRNATQRDQLLSELPSDGVVLSGDEAAQIREALALSRSVFKSGEPFTRRVYVALNAALSLFDSAGEETG